MNSHGVVFIFRAAIFRNRLLFLPDLSVLGPFLQSEGKGFYASNFYQRFYKRLLNLVGLIHKYTRMLISHF